MTHPVWSSETTCWWESFQKKDSRCPKDLRAKCLTYCWRCPGVWCSPGNLQLLQEHLLIDYCADPTSWEQASLWAPPKGTWRFHFHPDGVHAGPSGCRNWKDPQSWWSCRWATDTWARWGSKTPRFLLDALLFSPHAASLCPRGCWRGSRLCRGRYTALSWETEDAQWWTIQIWELYILLYSDGKPVILIYITFYSYYNYLTTIFMLIKSAAGSAVTARSFSHSWNAKFSI